FHPLNDPSPYPVISQAMTAEDGTFTINTFRTGDGAQAGEYAVTFLWHDLHTNSQGESTLVGKDKLGGRYRDPASPPYKVTVRAGANEPFTFNLSRAH